MRMRHPRADHIAALREIDLKYAKAMVERRASGSPPYPVNLSSPLPPLLITCGWVPLGNDQVFRQQGDVTTARVWIDPDRRGEKFPWAGERYGPDRQLAGTFGTGIGAMVRIELADEVEGPSSRAWAGQNGPTRRRGWSHTVRQGRDVWHRLGPHGDFLVVASFPAGPGGEPLYRASIQAHPLAPSGQWFNTPHDAIDAVEAAAGLASSRIVWPPCLTPAR